MARTPNDPNKKKVTAAMLQSLIDDLSAKQEMPKREGWETLATWESDKPTPELPKGN
jgi:hypothetical protein